MALKIIRNDITKMSTDAIVNTANNQVMVGTGCDRAVYEATGYDKLLSYRAEQIGRVEEGEVFITPGFDLPAKFIIHAVSPRFKGGDSGEEEKLRSCYRKSLRLAKEHNIKSIAFPLIATGGFEYPKEKGIRIALDEINDFLLSNEMMVYLVVFDEKSTALGERLYPDLKVYIDKNYVRERQVKEYKKTATFMPAAAATIGLPFSLASMFDEQHEKKLKERVSHISDSFSEYFLHILESRHMKSSDVYNRACVNKRTFSKIRTNRDYHPDKATVLCLCVGACLNLDESKDLMARAGYALSPGDKRDVIFSYFIENEIYDVIGIDMVMEEYGLPAIIK